MKTKDFLATVDYAILKPEVSMHTLLDATELCTELGVGCLCVKSCDVTFVAECLKGSETKVAAVVGFPHGNTTATLKAMEAQLAVAQGADEIDMVINVSALKDADVEYVTDEIHSVVTAVWPHRVKVILETALLTDAEIKKGVACAIKAEAAFVKTSTGFAASGATPHAVKLMITAAKGKVQVKASGGIRTREEAETYLEMGCTRLGVGDVLGLLTNAERKRYGL
ncbi:MAG: deoxyribose-phosphate aldolase [Kiritimatiellia bacterium]